MLNLFPEPSRAYCIVTPPYNEYSAGVKALHLLCHALNISGYRAFLAFTEANGKIPVNPYLQTPWLSREMQAIYPEPIAVYPDIIRGNPLKLKTVVRWLLGYPGVCGGDTEFSETDCLWSYSTRIARSAGNNNVLNLPVANPRIFFDNRYDNTQRDIVTYYAKKCEEIWSVPVMPPEGAVRLEGSLDDIAKLLRRSKECHVFEDSQVILEARMCGCPVIYHHHDRFKESHTAEDWDNRSYDNIMERFWLQFNRFVYETQRL